MAAILDAAKSTAAHLTGASEKQTQLKADTREPSSDTPLKSYFGVSQAHTDNSLKAGLRGPTLLQDSHFREKISHFDHERIPERVVHARGTAVHGYFTLHTPLTEFTTARILTDTSLKTPTFVRFSTVQGSKGSADTVRDVRGFATRFYTPEGNWDIVGNDIPVFFVQDAIKFVDIIHAVKPEPDTEMPQGQTAHDNAWDFFSLNSETAHTLIWAMSDRGIPRSYRHMQGFGVHSFILVNAEGKRSFVKFHWTPKLGVHSLVWDEALKLNGQDPDFHRRDLYEAIQYKSYPEYELGVQIVPEENEHDFDFDLLDSTKIIPEELVPVKYIGTMVLDRIPDEFFPETEQVAFCTQHMVPGIEHSNDPLLQGRGFSYFDTQISRLGGPNFGDIPINRPVCPVHNLNRDGAHRRPITKGPNYWPNRFEQAPHPIPPQQGGYLDSMSLIENGAAKVRGRGAKFSEHYNQATLYWNSMSPVEQDHIVAAMSFELSRVDDRGVHERSIAHINNIDNTLAKKVAVSLGLPEPKPVRENHGFKSAFLSMQGPHNKFTPSGRKIGIYVLDGFSAAVTTKLQAEILAIGSIPVIVGPRKGEVTSSSGISIPTHFTHEGIRSTIFDAVFFAGGEGPEYSQVLRKSGRLIHAAREAYSHFKAIGASGSAVEWLATIALPGEFTLKEVESGNGTDAPGIVLAGQDTEAAASLFTERFLGEVSKHRAWARDVSAVAA